MRKAIPTFPKNFLSDFRLNFSSFIKKQVCNSVTDGF
jgi:hypothetical protein